MEEFLNREQVKTHTRYSCYFLLDWFSKEHFFPIEASNTGWHLTEDCVYCKCLARRVVFSEGRVYQRAAFIGRNVERVSRRV